MDIQNISIGMGAIESPEDLRDWTLASVGASEVYPTSCFLDTNWMIPSNQGKIGSCVGCTGEEMVRQIVYLTKGNTPPEELSFRFVYAMAKCLEGKPGYEMYSTFPEGTYPALVAKIIRKFGVPLAKYCPNDISLSHEDFVFNRNENNIPAEVFIDAMSRTSGADFSVPCTEDGIKQSLNFAQANKGGVMILRRIGDTYWKDKNGISTYNKDDLLPIRVPARIVSGHEEFLTGYDYEPDTNRMRIYWLNHWSNAWADNGRGWEYFDEWQSLIKEIRVVVAEVPVVDDFKYTFTKAMKKGDKGADVVALQHVLKLEGLFPKLQAFTGTFGVLTQTGVMALQKKYANEILVPAGLTMPTGVVGQFTIAWLNKHYGK